MTGFRFFHTFRGAGARRAKIGNQAMIDMVLRGKLKNAFIEDGVTPGCP
jgi:hypothetical protein